MGAVFMSKSIWSDFSGMRSYWLKKRTFMCARLINIQITLFNIRFVMILTYLL